MQFLYLIENEAIKLSKRRRFLLVNLIVIVLIALFAYGQKLADEQLFARVGTTQWKPVIRQQIYDLQNRQKSLYIPEERKKTYQVQVQQLQYELDHDINPLAPGSAAFVRIFMNLSISLLLPLIVVTLAADLISSEWGEGTIKALLTRPIARWKILLSKLLTLLLYVSLLLMTIGVLATGIGSLFFGWGGWDMPVATGFQVINGQLDTSQVMNIPQWQFIMESYGLGFVVAMSIGLVTCAVSIIVRNTAATMGILLAAVIAGNILSRLASSWVAVKYLFSVNLGLTGYLSGQLPPIAGMSLPFSIGVLAVWSLLALVVSFVVFMHRDILA
ncbi:ABC transporter permease [Fodinisporobacter ferrooxydans]|uniref:ABC transporter permease n=1 Tax=Fodinisporobacter ferrooxydans TaxID=2901836 RepID=UPI003241F3C1